MTQFLLPPGFRATDANDNPLAGGYYLFYSAGTTTPKAVYSDADLSTSLGTQVNLNASGAPVSGANTPVLIYLNTGDYKVELYDSADTLLFTFDDIPGAEEAAAEVTTALPTTPVISKSSAYTVTANERGKLINANPTGGSFAITLPSAVTLGDNFRVGVRHNGSANQVSVISSGSQFVRAHKALRSYSLTGMGETAWFVSDGSDWIVDGYHPPFLKATAPYFRVLDRLTAPPANPDAGARYIINGAPTGSWNTLGFAENDIAEADGNGSWIRLTPETGWMAFDADEEQTLQYKDGTWENFQIDPGTSTLKTLIVTHIQSSGVNGGSATTSAWTKATLNTSELNTINDSSLASSVVTLPAGRYRVRASKSFVASLVSRIRWKTVSDTSVVIYSPAVKIGHQDGSSSQNSSTGSQVSLVGEFEISESTDFQLEYYVQRSGGTDAQGEAQGSGVAELYAKVIVEDISSLQGPKGDQGDPGGDGLDAAYWYQWSTSTSGDPGTGKVRTNHATPASVTEIAVHQTDAAGAVLTTVIASWDDSTSAKKARIRWHKEGAVENFFEFRITGTGTDAGDYWTFPVEYIGHGGTISNGNDLAVIVVEIGEIGDPGTTVPDISGLTEDTANDDEADHLIEYDASAGSHKKVLPKNLGFTPAGIGAIRRGLQAKLREISVTPEDFGVVSGLAVSDSDAENNVVNMQKVLDYAGNKGRPIYCPDQYYVFKDDGPRSPTGVHVYGNGVDYWDPIFPQNPKGWAGTNFIVKGASGATTKHNITGITSMRYAGGWREDPSNPGEYFKLTSLMNADASGTTPATPRQLSVFYTGKNDAVNWGLHGIRIVPWLGTDGISDYSNQSNAALSDPWDIGLLLEDHEGVDISDVQVVGHWRVWGCAIVSPGFADYGHSERNSLRRCKFQGVTGFGIRGGDQWAISARTSSTVTVRWSEESYWPSGAGGFEAVGSGTVDYTNTGTTRVTNDLRFDGVSPDPTVAAPFQLRNPNDGTGFAGTQIEDVYCYGLDHESGDDSEAMGLEISKAFEMSGSPMRGVQAFNFKCHTNERVIAYLHDVQDFLSFGWQVEGAGHIIASPATGSSSATAPVGDTGNVRIYAGVGFVDVLNSLWTPRSQYRDGDQINPRDENEGHFLLKALASQDLIVELATGRSMIVRNDDEVTVMSIAESTGQVTFPNQTNFTGEVTGSANVRAGASSALYFSGRGQFRSPSTTQIDAKNSGNTDFAHMAMAHLELTDGVTAPGTVTGRASIYVDTADGDLKVKFADGTVKTIVTDT